MNPFLMAFLRATSLILNDTVTKKTENNRLQNHQYRHSDNDNYNPVPEEISNITRQYAEEIGFQVCRIKDIDGSFCYMIKKYNRCEFVVRFPEKIDNLPVRVIDSEVFENNGTDNSPAEWVEEVYIPETVTVIKDRAFADCVNLEEVHFSGNILGIFPDSFHNCPKLKNLPVSKMHKTTNPYHFDAVEREDRDGRKCYEITSYNGYDTMVRFPEYIGNLPVRIIGTEVFARKNYDTDKWEVHWVEQVWIPKTVILIKDWAFMDCKELEKIHFEGDVPEIQPDAFLRCDKLINPPPLQKHITEPWRKPESYNTQNPTVFETERISGRNAVRITKICSYQDEIIVPEKIDCLPVVRITGGVQRDRDERRRNNGNYTLKKIYFPDSVEEIGEMAFMKCWGLESIRLPNNAGLVLCKDSFWNCEKLRLENVTFPDGKDFSDYMNAFRACIGMEADYHRKMCFEHEQVMQRKQFFSEKSYISGDNSKNTDKFVIISEKYNNIYDALHYYDHVIIDGYEKIGKSCAWLLNYVDTCNIVFRDGGNTAVIPIIGNYKRYPDSLINERLKLYKNCIENTTTDGKFFDTRLYDENILNLLPSIKRKLDVCYYRLSSGYRLSPEHSAMYEKFVRKHSKKSVYRAIDANDRKRLEWCRKLGLLNRHYNAVLEYAKRKDNADILE